MGGVLVVVAFSFAIIATALESREERRTRRNANRLKLVRREPVRFDVQPLNVTRYVWCDWGGHSVEAVSDDPERIGHTVCCHCVEFRKRDVQSFFTQESA